MDYYGQSSAATVPTGHSPTWYEAVNAEYFYDKNQIQDMNSNNHQMYATGGSVVAATPHHSVNNVVHEQPLTMLTTAEQTHTNIDYYQRPTPMQFSSDANYLPTPVPSLSLPPPPLPSSSTTTTTSYMNGDGNALVTYAPCQGPRPWNFAQCYGFYDQPACPLLNIIDMEDFM